MAEHEKYIPRPAELVRAFYRAIVASGQMHICQCKRCGTYSHPPRYFCPKCSSDEQEFVAISGRGRVYSLAVSHVTSEQAWQPQVPFATVVVELDQGPRVVGSADSVASGTLHIGDRVLVVPEPRREDFAYLRVTIEPEEEQQV